MRAAYVEQLGDPSVVTIRDVDVRSIGSGVRVAVRAASVNFPDVLVCAGRYQLKVDPPFIPGSEFAGVVVDSGERVFGSAMVGAFAEEIIVPASSLTPMPDSVDWIR